MKTWIILLALLAGVQNAVAQSGSVRLIVTGVQTRKGGELSAGLFKQSDFPEIGKQIIGKRVRVDSVTMVIVFPNVPTGSYGVAVFQDIDSNQDLKTNFVGLPQEPVGFSNDARINFGPPSFEDARFDVKSNSEVQLKIILR